MSSSPSVAANPSNDARKGLGFYHCRKLKRLLIWPTERELAGNFSIGRSRRQWNSAGDFIFFARYGEIVSNRREDHEIRMLALRLIQNCMLYINTE
jgi:Tn3 transposase DDE domain